MLFEYSLGGFEHRLDFLTGLVDQRGFKVHATAGS